MSNEKCLGLGILGAARNVPFSVLNPLRANSDLAARLKVVGVASLEKSEAEACAKEWGLPKAYDSFEDMLADPCVHAIYNVLPNPVRCHWTIRALMAGKHVLSETPSVSNGREAVVAQRAAEDMGRVLLEGAHPLCHPVTKRVREMILEGKIGKVEHIDLDIPIGHSLQGKMVCSKTGATMGVGCHGVAIVRALAGEEPVVISASAQLSQENPRVDTVMNINLKFPSGTAARIGCSVIPTMAKAPTKFTITGYDGIIRVQEWFTGHGKSANEISFESFTGNGEQYVERVDNPQERDTFYFMLMHFVDEVFDQERSKSTGMPWAYSQSKGPADAVRNMALMDAIYKRAGLTPKPTTNPPPTPYDHIGKSKL